MFDVTKPVSLCVEGKTESLGMTLQQRLHASCHKNSPHLKIVSFESLSTLATVSASNSTRQYAVTKELKYVLSDSKGEKSSGVQTVRVQKPLVMDNNLMLSADLQQSQVQDIMTQDLYFLLRLRLYNDLNALNKA